MKRPTRSMWNLVQVPPVHSEMVDADVVDVNTHEAQNLFAERAQVIQAGELHNRKMLVLWHGGKKHLWIAGWLDGEPTDDFPIPVEAQAA